jgi:drug/metabolite transporter (DMT)-like permease
MYWFAIFMAVMSNVFYHVCQKTIPSNANPVFSLVFTYVIAAFVSLGLLAVYPVGAGGFAGELKRLNWSSALLGVAIVGLELGFLLAYRAGWNINIAGVVVSVLVGLVILPVGYLLFSDTLTIRSAIGIIFCITGLIFINYK